MTKNLNILAVIFIMAVFFQMTIIKNIWGIEWISRIFNTVLLIVFSLYALWSLVGSYNYKVFNYYLIPGLMVYTGIFLNISINSIVNPNIINQFGLLISWAAYLAIPYLVKYQNLNIMLLWRYFHYFMLITVSVSIIEYYKLFNNFIIPKQIMTSGGTFMAGNFSILHVLETGELYYRFYASFYEPGTLAMLLLPVISYAFLYRKYFSLTIYLFAMFLTDSLGGFIAVAMLVPILAYLKFRKQTLLSAASAILIVILMTVLFADYFLKQYDSKGRSATVRVENVTYFLTNLPEVFVNYPLGLPLAETTEQARKNPYYFGSNFTPGNAFNLGGIISFLGYCFIIIVSLWFSLRSISSKNLSIEEQAAASSLIPLFSFLFQRTSIWDGIIFVFLYAPFIVGLLQNATRKLGGGCR